MKTKMLLHFCFFFCCLQGFAQTGTIGGKLILKNDTFNTSSVKLLLAREYDAERDAAVTKDLIDTLWLNFDNTDPSVFTHVAYTYPDKNNKFEFSGITPGTYYLLNEQARLFEEVHLEEGDAHSVIYEIVFDISAPVNQEQDIVADIPCPVNGHTEDIIPLVGGFFSFAEKYALESSGTLKAGGCDERGFYCKKHKMKILF